MKRVFLSAIVVLAVTFSVNSQTFGVKTGLNLASITGDDTEDFDGRTCFHIGAVVEFEISDSFSFQPELMYSGQGASLSGTEDGIKYEADVKIDYLNIPLMAKFYAAEGFSIEAGPQIGFLLSAKEEWKVAGESGEEDIEEFVKDIDFGINFGLGYKLESGVNFGARYNLGLSNANDEDDSDDIEMKNGVFQISVGYFF